jgi:uncharacterized protein (DUF2147 family)
MATREAIKAGLLLCAASLALPGTSSAAEIKDMIGTWKWTDYTVEVKECSTNPSGAGLCATVIDGPKNKGMEMIRSKLEKKGSDFLGHIGHPATGDIYDTKLTMKNADTWSMAGCVINNNNTVCATGDFIRVK